MEGYCFDRPKPTAGCSASGRRMIQLFVNKFPLGGDGREVLKFRIKRKGLEWIFWLKIRTIGGAF
jgi:hypothetical protein